MKYTMRLLMCCSLVSIQCNAMYLKKTVIAAAKNMLNKQIRKNSTESFKKIKGTYCLLDGSYSFAQELRKNEINTIQAIDQAIKTYELIPTFQEKRAVLDLLKKHHLTTQFYHDCRFCLHACKQDSGEIYKILLALYEKEEQEYIRRYYHAPNVCV